MSNHAMLSINLPLKKFDAFQGVVRGFMWMGKKDVKGGHCLVAWNKVA
jgi:hypothetical protein